MDRSGLHGRLNLLLLALLASGPTHGYALVTELRRRSNGALAVIDGSLYPALHRLEGSGLVTSTFEVADGRRRRRYEITADGKIALQEEIRSWQEFKDSIDDALGDVT